MVEETVVEHNKRTFAQALQTLPSFQTIFDMARRWLSAGVAFPEVQGNDQETTIGIVEEYISTSRVNELMSSALR